MTRLLLLFALLFASGATTAQGPLALRLDDAEMNDDAISFGGLVRGLHVLAPEAEGPQPVIIFSALVVDGEILARGKSEFIAMGVRSEEIRRGVTLRDSRIELDREYMQRRAKTPMLRQFLMPDLTEEPESCNTSVSFFPCEMHFPGEMLFPGDMLFPGEMFAPEAEDPTSFPGKIFVASRAKVDARGSIRDRDLIRAAERTHPEAARAGEPVIVFYAAVPGIEGSSEIAGLRRRPSKI